MSTPTRTKSTGGGRSGAASSANEPCGTRAGDELPAGLAMPVDRRRVPGRERVAWLLAAGSLGVASLAAAALLVVHGRGTITDREYRFLISPPDSETFGALAVSPDGRHVAFTAAGPNGLRLWVRPLASSSRPGCSRGPGMRPFRSGHPTAASSDSSRRESSRGSPSPRGLLRRCVTRRSDVAGRGAGRTSFSSHQRARGHCFEFLRRAACRSR